MPADASIYGMIRPQAAQPGPLDQYAQGMQIRNMIDAGELSGMQREQMRRQMSQEEAVQSVFSRLQPGQSMEDLLPDVMRVSPKAGIDLQGKLLDNKKKVGDIGKTDIETHALQVKGLRDQLATVQNDAGLVAFIEKAGKIYGPQVFASAPKSVNDPNFGTWREKQVMDASALLERIKPHYSVEDFGGTKGVVQSNPNATGGVTGIQAKTQTPDSVASNRLGWANLGETRLEHGRVAARADQARKDGKWSNDLERGIQVNMQTGETRPITQGGVPVQRDPKLTEDQGKATGWLVQADNAYKNIVKVMDGAKGNFFNPAKPGFPDMVAAIPSFGVTEGIGHSMRTEGRQKFVQASESLSEALLRAATGAGVNKEEAAQKIRELTPRMGEEDSVIKQKMEAIPLYIESLKVRAGPGAAQLPGIVARGAPKAPPTTAEIDAELRRRKVIP